MRASGLASRRTYVTNGQDTEKFGMNSIILPSLFSQMAPGPESPEENRTKTSRAPSCMNPLQTDMAIAFGQVCIV